MADRQTYQLTANSSPAANYVVSVQHPSGSSEAQKTTILELKTVMSLQNLDNTSDATKWAATATLTNKTINLSSNTLTMTLAQLNSAVSDADVVSLAGSETLTNKTISGASNTFSSIPQSAVTSLTTDLAAKQPLDSDLTTIAGLTPSANDVLQYISGAWANRTISQLKTSLALTESDISGLVSDLAGKQGTLTLTTTGTSGAATLVGNTLNIPQYSGGGGGGTWGSITGTLSSQTDLQTALNNKKSINLIDTSSTGAHGFTVGMAVQKATGGTWQRCRAVSTSNSSYIDGVVLSVPTSTTFVLGQPGDFFDATGLGLASNTVYYLSTSSSGINYSSTAPSAIGEVYKEVFKTNAANQAYIINGPSFEITSASSGSGGGGNKWWKYQQWEHFTIAPQTTQNGSSFVMSVNSGTGATFTTGITANSTMTGYRGVVQGSTGTTATGWAALGTVNTPNSFRFDGTTKSIVMTKLYIDTLRDGTDDYRILFGFTDGVGNGTTGSDGAYFLYSSASANWQIVTKNNSVATTNTSSVTVNALTTYILEVEFDGTGFIFYINGVNVNPSSGAPITTNIPITSGRECGLGVIITKTAGTTARTVNVDWMALGEDFS